MCVFGVCMKVMSYCRIFKEQQEAILGLKKTRVERVKDALARLENEMEIKIFAYIACTYIVI